MKKLLLLAVLVLGTSFMANAATPVKNATVKEVKAKHPKHRKSKKAKMAAAETPKAN